MASTSAPRILLRPARRLALSARRTPTPITITALARPLSTTRARLQVKTPDGAGVGGEMDVGELEGAKFRVEPIRRVGEDDRTMRARLTYQSRKRGTLESDLLLSTFADAYLPSMTREQMAQYDKFLDENDWDIYYWATQEPPPSSTSSPSATETRDTSDAGYGGGLEAALGSATTASTTTTSPIVNADAVIAEAAETETDAESAAAAAGQKQQTIEPYDHRQSGEWAQTVGTFRPAYRPVPARWRDSEVLRLLREHVRARAAAPGGMAFMPDLRRSS